VRLLHPDVLDPGRTEPPGDQPRLLRVRLRPGRARPEGDLRADILHRPLGVEEVGGGARVGSFVAAAGERERRAGGEAGGEFAPSSHPAKLAGFERESKA
jgi:hypothetical protein